MTKQRDSDSFFASQIWPWLQRLSHRFFAPDSSFFSSFLTSRLYPRRHGRTWSTPWPWAPGNRGCTGRPQSPDWISITKLIQTVCSRFFYLTQRQTMSSSTSAGSAPAAMRNLAVWPPPPAEQARARGVDSSSSRLLGIKTKKNGKMNK